MTSPDRNAPCPCGSTKKYKHCCQRKANTAVNIRPQRNPMIPVWLQLGMQSMRADRWQNAKLQYEQVLLVDPINAEARQWMAVILHKERKTGKALELMQGVVHDYPANPQFHMTLANICKENGNADMAIQSYRNAIALQPDFAEALYSLGVIHAFQGSHLDAIDVLQKAVAIIPDYADAYYQLGLSFIKVDRKDEAQKACRNAIRIRPNFAEAISCLGNLLVEVDPAEAFKLHQSVAKLQPNSVEPWLAMYSLLLDLGQLEQARLCSARIQAAFQKDVLTVNDALLVPRIMGTNQEISDCRRQLTENLERLIAEGITIQDPIIEGCSTNFYLAFHGQNNRDIQKRIAYLYEKACPSLMYVAPHCTKPSKEGGHRKKIGFFSKYITHHSVAISFGEIINELSAMDQYDIVLITLAQESEHLVRETYKNFSGDFVVVSLPLAEAQRKISNLELDLLIYLDVGMDAFSYFLAYARLAPIQCVAGGHPDTTGIGALDYYLSSDIVEPPDAQEHYSEKLVRLPFGLFYFEKPTRVEGGIPARREDYLLPNNGAIYLCPVMLFKLHPDFDLAIERILEKDPTGHVVLVSDKKVATRKVMLNARLDKTINARVRDRIVFIPWVSGIDAFMNLLELADVVLDPFHFGIGTTGIPIFTVGTPYVTLPSRLMRGRVGMYFYELIGVRDGIAADFDDYVDKAIRIANDRNERERIKSLILSNNKVLFENRRAIQDFVDFVEQVMPEQRDSIATANARP